MLISRNIKHIYRFVKKLVQRGCSILGNVGSMSVCGDKPLNEECGPKELAARPTPFKVLDVDRDNFMQREECHFWILDLRGITSQCPKLYFASLGLRIESWYHGLSSEPFKHDQEECMKIQLEKCITLYGIYHKPQLYLPVYGPQHSWWRVLVWEEANFDGTSYSLD